MSSQRPRQGERDPADRAGTRARGRRGDPSSVSLHNTIGNRAVAAMVARQPKTSEKAGKATTPGTAAEILAAEAWITYIALRGNGPKPTVAVPDRYRGLIETVRAGVAGNPGEIDHLDIAASGTLLKRLRRDHDQVVPKADHTVFTLAALALERALINVGNGPDAFEGGATQQDYAMNLAGIWTQAGDEVKAAKAAGYAIPERLQTAEEEARAMYDAADAGWANHAPDSHKLITPSDEAGLVEFRKDVVAAINDMREKRAADEARARRREAEALQTAADRQLTELRVMMADKRREAFLAGATGKLKRLNEATGEITTAISETKAAAGIITSRVDQLNSLHELFSKKGGALINLPSMPAGVTAVSGHLFKAHDTLTKALDLMEILSPGKTQLDAGLKYLRGADMALEHFAAKDANPFVAVYVNAYLGPGIKNCVKLIGDIAGRISDQNRSLIGGGRPDLVNWKVEPGGEAVYAYLALLFRQGAQAPLSDPAWDYFDDHDDDLAAAVDDAMPGRSHFGDWAYRNRYRLWEAFYGSTPPPRG